MFLFTKLVFSRGLAEAGRVRGWLNLSEEFARVTEEEAGRGFMEDGRESNEDWDNVIFINYKSYFLYNF